MAMKDSKKGRARRATRKRPGGRERAEKELATNRTPRSPDAKERLVIAARKLFFRYGYEDVSTEMLAAEAGMSKTTMYKLFPHKSDIFSAVIAYESRRFRRPIDEMPSDRAGLKSAIHEFGFRLLELLADPEISRFEQLMIGQAHEHKAIAGRFYREAHAASYENLGQMIAVAQENGLTANRTDPQRLAMHLITLWKGDVHVHRQLGLRTEGYGDLAGHVDQCMDLVLGPLRT